MPGRVPSDHQSERSGLKADNFARGEVHGRVPQTRIMDAARKVGYLVLALAVCVPAGAAANSGVISGYVRDNSGAPLMGAVVEISTSYAILGTTVFTDSRGSYSAKGLPAGTYHIKANATTYLPSLRENVSLRSGAHVLVNLTLSTLADALKLLPTGRRDSSEDEWRWALRAVNELFPAIYPQHAEKPAEQWQLDGLAAALHDPLRNVRILTLKEISFHQTASLQGIPVYPVIELLKDPDPFCPA